MKNSEYRVISVESILSTQRALTKLIKEVNEAIAQGWEPIGGIAMHSSHVMQAMMKRR
jgi:hypothetical protein